MIEIVSLSIAVTAFTFALIAMIFAFLAWSTCVGLKNSTHRVQYIPVQDPSFDKFSSEDLKPKLDEETGEELPVNNGDDTTGLGLLNQFKKHLHVDEEI